MYQPWVYMLSTVAISIYIPTQRLLILKCICHVTVTNNKGKKTLNNYQSRENHPKGCSNTEMNVVSLNRCLLLQKELMFTRARIPLDKTNAKIHNFFPPLTSQCIIQRWWQHKNAISVFPNAFIDHLNQDQPGKMLFPRCNIIPTLFPSFVVHVEHAF